MNNNIGNMNPNPLGFNPQGHKAQVHNECCDTNEIQEETMEDKDPLKHVPGDNYGRAMVNKMTGAHASESATIEDDLYVLDILSDFAKSLKEGYIEKGVDPQRAEKLTLNTISVLLNLEQ